MNENSKIGRLKNDLSRAKEKAAEWQARVRDIERQITEQENLEILRTVRSVVTSPEDLRGLLDRIQAAGMLEAPDKPPDKAPSPDGEGKEGAEWQGYAQ